MPINLTPLPGSNNSTQTQISGRVKLSPFPGESTNQPSGVISNKVKLSSFPTVNVTSLANAIKQTESSGNYNAKGKSGEYGAYQFMPDTWKVWAGEYLGNPNAPMTPKNQDAVAAHRISELTKRGYSAAQIASIWNSGKPNYQGNVGVNKQGVKYDVPAYVNKVIQNYTFKPTISGFMAELPNTLKGFFSNTVQGVKSLFQDPLNITPSTTGQGNIQFGKDLYDKTIGSIANTAIDEKNRVGNFLNSFKKQTSTSQKAAAGIKTVSGAANVVFSPLTALFQGAEQFPVLGTIAKAITLPFTALGDAGSHTAITALDHLPLDNTVKNNLRDAIGEISGLAFQILGGKAMGEVLTSDKIAELQSKFGTDGANKIIDTVKEKVGERPGTIPNTEKVTGMGKKLSTPLSPEELNAQQAGFVNPGAPLESAKAALEALKQGQESARFGSSLRTFFTGERDMRVADTNQFRDSLQRLVPNAIDQEALSVMRDFKNDITGLTEKLDRFKKSQDSMQQKLVPVIERALHPSPEMITADRAMSNYFTSKLEEGKKLKFLDSKISPDEYVTHLLNPKDEITPQKSGLFNSKIGKSTPFAKERYYPTILDAVENGVKPKTLNAFDALTIYGDKHATVAATKILVNELKNTDMGKWGFRTSENIPTNWVELAPGKELFRNRMSYINEEGKPSIATQNLYVPQKVADALKPIIEPSGLSNLPGFRKGRLYQSYIKTAELGLSIFHMKALNITAFSNEGLRGVIKSYANDLKSPEFLDTEKSFIRAGGTTSILGRTIEAYNEVKPSSLPSRMDMIRSLPGVKQLDFLAHGLTKVTFDIMQRKFKVTDFALKDAAWLKRNINATEAEHFTAQKAISKEINATYGGLQWENIGINKSLLDLSKFLILAPDWTFSNFLNAKYAFEGGPAGKAARMFWIRSAITGTAMNQGMSLMMSGQLSKDPTQVYLGKDKNGKEIYTNMFFVGANNDLINLYKNIKDYGLISGSGQFLAAKSSPFLKAGTELLTNRNYLGQDIAPKGSGPIVGTALTAKNAAKNLSPIPFTISNIWSMITDPKKQYTWKEFITILGGNKPRHVVPEGEREVTSGRRKGQLVPATPKTKLPILEQIKTGKIYQKKKK